MLDSISRTICSWLDESCDFMECCGKGKEGAEVVADVCGVHACALQQEFQRQQQEALKRLQQQQAMQNIQVTTGPPIDLDLPVHLVPSSPNYPLLFSHFPPVFPLS